MANEAFTDGVRLLFQPLSTTLALTSPVVTRTATQTLSLPAMSERPSYFAVDVMVRLTALDDANVALQMYGVGLAETTGGTLHVRRGCTITRRMRILIGSDRRLAVRLSAPCAACSLRITGTWT